MNNYVSIKGILGQNPKSFEGKKSNFSVISIAQNYLSGGGEKRTSWFDAIAFGKLSERITKLQKGDLIHVEGYLQPQKLEIAGQNYILNKVVIQSVQKIAKLETPTHPDIPLYTENVEVPF